VLGTKPVDVLADFVHPSFAPDLTLWFDVSPSTAAERLATGRDEKDRFEQEQIAFFSRVRAGYAELAKVHASRFVRVDGEAPVDRVAQHVNLEVSRLLLS
jgi:dTMP kinase